MKKESEKSVRRKRKRACPIPAEVLDGLIAQYGHSPEAIMGPEGLLRALTAGVMERALEAELDVHLGYDKHGERPDGSSNTRNGYSAKTLRTDKGAVRISVPRDREGDFSPQLIPKHQRSTPLLQDQMVALYARGMTTREIQSFLEEMYGVEVSPELISRATDAVQEKVDLFRNRALDAVYPIVYMDCLFVPIRKDRRVSKHAVYVVLGISMEGKKEILGLFVQESEGAKFWLSALTELKNRGVQDMLLCCCDGLKGFPEAIEAVFPKAVVQTCIVHVIRNALRYVNYKERKEVAKDLRSIYSADTEEQALQALEAAEDKWQKSNPLVCKIWRDNWERIRPFFEFPEEIRKVIYTTNIIEAVNSQIRKVIRNKGALPSEEALMKILYLALDKAASKWTQPIPKWNQTLQFLDIHFQGRLNP